MMVSTSVLPIIATFSVVFLIAVGDGAAVPTLATVYSESVSDLNIDFTTIDKNGVAWGWYSDFEDQKSGFGELTITTNPNYSADAQFFAAGYLEGALTAKRIYHHFVNMDAYNRGSNDKDDYESGLNFLTEQRQWTQDQISNNPDDDYWNHVGMINAQLDGLIAGYKDNFARFPDAKALKDSDFLMLNGVGDLFDIIPAVSKKARPDWESMGGEQIKRELQKLGHCSALIKVTGDFSDLFMGHSSWFTYAAMQRIFKNYNFQVQGVAAQRTSFSSYPGFLESLDDFYMMDSGLMMTQTSNGILNDALYDLITPHSLLAWQRVRLSNMVATSGHEWAEVFEKHHSGTYVNQYMIVDTKLFTPQQALPRDLLWVIEEIPGLVESADVTASLDLGYWPSYNVPFFANVYNESGYTQFSARFGERDVAPGTWTVAEGVDYQMAPRAKIFRRDQGSVIDLVSFKHMMRYNDYEHDPYANGDPAAAICSRYDLSSDNPEPFGAYDTKVTSYSMMKSLRAHVINGPTTQDQPPFSWTGDFASVVHAGLPQTFDFEFEPMSAFDHDDTA